jgi:protein TonB
MLDRHLHQPTVFQASMRDRIATGLVVLVVHGLLAIMLLMDLTARVHHAIAEGPAMALLFIDRPAGKLPAPIPADVTIPNPRALHPRISMPEIVVMPEPPTEAPRPSPVETTPYAITAPPNPLSESQLVASSISGDTGAGGSGAGAAANAAGQGGAGGLDINPYLRRVSAHIQRFLIPRGMPKGTPDRGVTYVYLHWTQNGTIVATRVLGSSGDDWIDRNALLAVTRANRLPPIPPEFQLKAIEGRLPVLFSRW